MKINTTIKYEEQYLPTKRHRIPRIREVEEPVTVELREVNRSDVSVALIVSAHKHYIDGDGNHQFGSRDTPYLAYNGELFTEKRDVFGVEDRGALTLHDFQAEIERRGNYYYSSARTGNGRDAILQSLNEFMNNHILVDGVIHERASEPRYVIVTFGLGYNHGGTGFFVEDRYNPNISKSAYFSALQRDEAIAYGKNVAARRGDTEDIDRIGCSCDIKVLMPEMVRCNPAVEHDDGNPFLNSLESLVEASSDTLEAGLLVMAAASQIQSETRKPPLADRMADAHVRSEAQDTGIEAPTKDEYSI